MKSEQNSNEFIGNANSQAYTINDNKAAVLHRHWQKGNVKDVVQNILSDETLWSTDVNLFTGFTDAVEKNMMNISTSGVKNLFNLYL